jgi:hypothetical protein
MAAIAAGMFGVAFILYADSQVAGSVIARPLGWLPPLAAVLVITGVGWILLAQHGREDEHAEVRDSTLCPACEREILGKWRMCPYCGAMLDRTVDRAAIGAGQPER